MSVVIETTLGDITVDLYLSERPRTCLNFLKLCKMKYYNYHLFHTISRGFIAQTGDPTGSRSGGESFYGVLDGSSKRYFEGENEPRIKHTKMGLISFVGNEERMIGSQFFITLGEDLTYLDQKHCVFGEVVEGYDVLEELNEVICDTDDRPYQDVRITHTVILDDPYPDPRKLAVPSRSPSPSAERLQGGRIAPDEEIDETEGKSAQEVAEVQADREAKARATILEMVGDLPDAEMAPPENVLFVCKLNPVTTDDDLEIIFNRFGKIVSCEVIRDRKTGDSLQYAFIEFSDRKACEDAYFKMDNILIDDRRIHVDFSQSVSKVKWLGKGRGVAHFDEKGRRTTNPNYSVGKGNYKVNIRDNPNGRHDLPNKDKETNSSSQRNRNNKSPLEEADQENSSRYRDHRDRSYDNKSNYRESSSRSLRRNSPRRIYSREGENRDRRRNNRDRSRSPRRNEDFRNWRSISNRERRHKSPSKRADDSRRYGRDMYGSNREYQSRRKYQNDERNRGNSRSRNNDRRTDRDRDSRYHRSNPSSSKTSERNPRKNDDSEDDRKSKEHKRRNTKEIKAKTESESSESEIEKRKEKQKSRKKNGVDKKYRKKKVESDSVSESSDSDSDEPKCKKAKIKLSSKKTEKRKVASSDSSGTSDTSDSSDSSDSVSSSESEKEKKKKKRRKNRKDDSSSDSSKSDVNEKKERRKRKK